MIICATLSEAQNMDTNDQVILEGFLTAYSNLVTALEAQDEKTVRSYFLTTNIVITTAPDPGRWVASDINLPYIKSGFSKEIMGIQVQNSTIGLVRTSTTAFWFAQDENGHWKLRKYLDKPIE